MENLELEYKNYINLEQQYKQYINGNEPITKEILRTLIKNDLDVRGVDTSQITEMGCLFSHTYFNQDISGWDTSNVIDMGYMFYGAKAFNQSLKNLDTSNVVYMFCMFRYANSLVADLSKWNVSKVEYYGDFTNNKKIIEPQFIVA